MLKLTEIFTKVKISSIDLYMELGVLQIPPTKVKVSTCLLELLTKVKVSTCILELGFP